MRDVLPSIDVRRVIRWVVASLWWSGLVCASSIDGRDYHVGAGSLDDALRAFVRQSDVQLLYPPALVEGLRSAGLAGHLEAQQALRSLLRDSGLQAVAIESNTFVLKKAPSHADAPARRPSLRIDPATMPVGLAPIEVTGTRIRRTDTETSAPLTVIGREQIEHSGYQTLYDLLRAQPGVRVSTAAVGMTDGAIYRNNGLSGANGAAAVDLRGLGSAATLFLIDGQRMAGYGLAQDNFGTVNDLNGIPLALVDRVDILRDGASAIYGSDAMAGVINIVLRKSATGVTIAGNEGVSSRGDARQRRFTSSIGGTVGNGTQVLVSADYFQRDPLLGAARSWSRPVPSAPSSLEDHAVPSADTFFLDEATVRFQPAECPVEKRRRGIVCIDDAVAATSLQTSMTSRSLFAHASRRLDAIEFHADVRWTRVDQRQQSAPVKDDLLLPADHPDNTARVEQAVYGYSFDDLGPVRNATVATTRFASVGAQGDVGESHWNASANSQRNDSNDRLNGLLRTDTFAKALARGRFRFNVANTAAVRTEVAPTLHRRARTAHDGFDADVSRTLATLPHGPLAMAIGVEAYRDRLDDTPDPLVLSNRIFQFQAPAARSVDRWSAAAYMELSATPLPGVETNAAWRVDRTEGYGHAVSPKFGVKWAIVPSVSVRGTWAGGYRAPTQLQLRHPAALSSVGFWTQVPNRVLPCAVTVPIDAASSYCQLRLTSVDNPRLRPERSRSYTLGLIWAPVTDASVTVDYFRIRRDDEINNLPVSYAVNHPERYPAVFGRNASGELIALDQQLVNLGHTDARVVDFDGSYDLATSAMGRFRFGLGANYLLRLDRAVVDGEPVEHVAGYASQPRWTGLASIDWRKGDWTTTANLRYTGHYRYAASSDAALSCPGYLREAGKCDTPAFVLVDFNVAYAGFRRWTVALNVHNLFDHAPVYYGAPGNVYNPLFDDVVGRSYLLSFFYRY